MISNGVIPFNVRRHRLNEEPFIDIDMNEQR
jgi:hypothetical protein